MTKNILIINANPKRSSFCQYVADTYECEAREQNNTQRVNLSALQFNPSLDCGYDDEQPLEPDLQVFQQQVAWADHVVIVSPIWWGSLPAKFKGLFDRSFLPGFAFKYQGYTPVPLLTDKTSRMVLTMDAPPQSLQDQAASVIAQLDIFTLQFSGFQPSAVSLFGSVVAASESEKSAWVNEIKQLGRAAK